MLRIHVLFSAGRNSPAGSSSSVPRNNATPACLLQPLIPQTNFLPEKQSMFHLIDTVRSGSQRKIPSRSHSQIGRENPGQFSSHRSGFLERGRLQSMAGDFSPAEA